MKSACVLVVRGLWSSTRILGDPSPGERSDDSSEADLT
jgi:hypothetical protein